jgi:hypothetical protein
MIEHPANFPQIAAPSCRPFFMPAQPTGERTPPSSPSVATLTSNFIFENNHIFLGCFFPGVAIRQTDPD